MLILRYVYGVISFIVGAMIHKLSCCVTNEYTYLLPMIFLV